MASGTNYSQEYGQAEKAYLESNFAQAAEIITHLAEEFPDDPNILLLRGHIYCYGFQNYNLAIWQYKRVLKLTKEQDLLDFARSGIEQVEQLQQQSGNLELPSKNHTKQSFKQTKIINNTEGNEKKTVVTQGFVDKLIDKIGKILKEQHSLIERDEEQEESIELLLEKVGLIENNFEELTKSLAIGSYPLKLARSIKVTESSISPKIEAINISKAQLIETYNEIVALLSGYTIPVTLTPDSYRDLNPAQIFLETTVKGNYWAITTLEKEQHKYWLVPNNNLKFNVHKLKTVETLFQLKGDYNSPTSEFILQEPAVLTLLPNNKKWQLLQPGILFFGNNLKSALPQSKPSSNVADDNQSKINKQILSTLSSFQTKVDELNNKINQLEIQSEISQKTYQREQQQWLQEKKALNEQLQKIITSQLTSSIESDRDSAEIIVNSVNKEVNNTKNKDINDVKIELRDKLSQFRQAYTQDIKLISDRIVAKVAISVETLEQITFYKPDVIILENTAHGKYWIIDYLGAYFLIPSEIHQITQEKETSLTVAKLLFHLSEYYPEYSNHNLIRPAIVTKLSAKQWKLEEKGKLNFS